MTDTPKQPPDPAGTRMALTHSRRVVFVGYAGGRPVWHDADEPTDYFTADARDLSVGWWLRWRNGWFDNVFYSPDENVDALTPAEVCDLVSLINEHREKEGL